MHRMALEHADDLGAPCPIDAGQRQNDFIDRITAQDITQILGAPDRHAINPAPLHVEIIVEKASQTHLGMRPHRNGEFLAGLAGAVRSEEHTSELQSLMRISYAVFCLKKKMKQHNSIQHTPIHTKLDTHTTKSSYPTVNIPTQHSH